MVEAVEGPLFPTEEQGYEEDYLRRRSLVGFWERVIRLIAILFAAWQVAVLAAFPLEPWFLRAFHLTFATALGLALIPGWRGAELNRVGKVDASLALLAALPSVYIVWEFKDLLFRAGVDPIPSDVFVGLVTIILTLEVTRRATGWALPIVAGLSLLYGIWGNYLPGILWHKGYSLTRVVSYVFSLEGIYTLPLAVSATYVFLFILFGAVLQASGTGKFFIDFAWAAAGWARGGPAKMSVISSSLFGTISGSSVANVMVDGWLNIPLMKSCGYGARFAGAVEALTSTGGQFMPPIMSGAAFLMAEITNRPYLDVAKAAAIPAILYYISVYCMIDLEAVKGGLRGLPRDKLPRFGAVLYHGWHHLLPIGLLMYALIVLQTSPIRAGLWGIGGSILASWLAPTLRVALRTLASTLHRHGLRPPVKIREEFNAGVGPQTLLAAFESGGKATVEVAVTCASAGIIIGVLSLTGLGMKFAGVLVGYAGGHLLPALILTAIVTIILGMGLPTMASYAIGASVIAPGIIQMGAPQLAAHLFVLYFACISAITPPVAVAAYAAAGIAKANPMHVGYTACRLGIAAFIIPFMFIYGPPLLLQGGWTEIGWAFCTACIGIFGLSVAMQGWFLGKMHLLSRGIALASSFLLIYPGLLTDVLGFALLGLALIMHRPDKLRAILGPNGRRVKS